LPKTIQYAPVLAKIGAERSKLLSEVKIKALFESKNLSEVAAQLRETTYQEQVVRIAPPLSGRKLERAYNENLIDAYLKILEYAPKHAIQFLGLRLLRLEIEHIKAIIKATNAKLSAEEKLAKIFFPVEDYLGHHAKIEEAAKASKVAAVVHSFKGTPYYFALAAGLKNFEETGLTSSFDFYIDKYYYDMLYENFKALSGGEQRHAEFYASHESDAFTLLTILRGKLLCIDPDKLRLIIPECTFTLPAKKIEALTSAVDFEGVLKIVLETPYGKYFNRFQNKHETISNAEKVLKKAVFKHAQASVITETFNIEMPLAFITQKEVEVHNLVALTLGLEAGLKPENIRNLLLL
jgi:V/A-type H+/Na+-transporting ATPase subunit C